MNDKRFQNPALWGCLVCALLIVSRWLTRSQSPGAQSVNTVLVLVVLVLSVQLVRREAKLFTPRFLGDPFALILLLMPALNLAVTVLGLVSKTLGGLFSSPWGTALLTLISTPVFLSGCFLYVSKKLPEDYPLRLAAVFITALTSVYVVCRLCDKLVFPLLTNAGISLPERLTQIAAQNGLLSLFVFILCLAAFLLMGRAVGTLPEKEVSHDA